MDSAEIAGQLIREQLAKMQRHQAESQRVLSRQAQRDVAAAAGKTIPFSEADIINYG